MGNRKAREFALQQERRARLAEAEIARSTPRPISRARPLYGLGFPRLQLVVCPSFENARAWEVRETQESWSLFRSDVTPDQCLVGFDSVPFDSGRLQEFFRRITSLTIPLMPDLRCLGGADGTVFQLAIFGDLYSEFRFQWWSEPPKDWLPLTGIASQMIEEFLNAEGVAPHLFAAWTN